MFHHAAVGVAEIPKIVDEIAAMPMAAMVAPQRPPNLEAAPRARTAIRVTHANENQQVCGSSIEFAEKTDI